MKLDTQILNPESISIQTNEARKGQKLVGHLRMYAGQKVFELNLKTKMITQVDLSENVAVDIKGKVHRKVVLKQDCLYVPAINLKNAEKKFIKML